MAVQSQNTPSIGEIVLDPNEKFADLDGVDKYDQLICDGSELDVDKYPLLAEKLPDLATTLPDMDSPDPSIPYRIIGDLT